MTNKKIISSPLSCGFGNKTVAIKQFGIDEFIPPLTNDKQIYIEPFMFSGSMFWNLQSVRSAILNDKFDLIWNFWNCVKNKHEELIKELEYVWIGKKWFEEYKQREDPIGKAVFLYLCLKGSVKGVIDFKFKYKYYVHPFEKDFTYFKEKMNNMSSLTIWDKDFRDLYEHIMNKKEGREFYIYADPPYVGIVGYKLNFTEQDHIDLYQLHEKMKNLPNYYLYISYNDHPLIWKLYKNWYIIKVQWQKGSNNKINEELLISNRPLKRYNKNINNKTIFDIIQQNKKNDKYDK